MRKIAIAIAVTMFLLVSFASAQQTTTNANKDQQTNSATPPPGPILGGMGTVNYIPIWAAPSFLLNSVIYQANGGNVGIGTTTPAAKLDVNGAISTNTSYDFLGTPVLTVTLNDSVFVGGLAGAHNAQEGSGNVFVGFESGTSNTTGDANTFLGESSGVNNTTGDGNSFYGNAAGGFNTSGNFNSAFGWNAGLNSTTGTNNSFYGNRSGYNNTTGNNDIYIGNLGPSSGTESSAIRIGGDIGTGYGPQTAAYIAGIYGVNVGGLPVQINSNGQLGAATSSLRFKEQVRDMGDTTNALMKLRPVTFLYKPEYANGERTLQYGLIAEEVAKVYPELVAYDEDGQPYSVRYQYLSTMLLNEVQKQYRRAETESKLIESQQQEIESLRQQLQVQKATLEDRLLRLENLVKNQSQTLAAK